MKNELESRIQQAMRSRLQHFRNQADSLTFEGVRRLLEKDLVLDTYALDEHKKYVKQLLQKYLSGTEDEENVSKDFEQNKVERVKEEEEEQPNEKKVTDIPSEDEVKNEDEVKVEDDSPVMRLISAKESAKSETLGNLKEKLPTEDMIKEAIWTRATYFRSKSEELTVAGVRRLLEEDLELKKFSLDSFKKLISKQLDEVLNAQSDTGSKSDADASHSESDDIKVEVKPKKNLPPKRKVQKSEAPRKRKKTAQETERVRKKKTKQSEETSVNENNVQDDESSEEKSVKKEVVAPVYGKKVERLKSIIKACGMSVAPTVYKKAKQAPEDKREAFLIKELQQLLSKEGLSTNPSEKEIKEVKRRKEKAKELEGIDMSNIVVGSRRRSTFNFVPPPKPKIESDSDDESEDSENHDGDGSEDTDNDNEGGDGDAQDEDDVALASQSEEVHEGGDGDAQDEDDEAHASQSEEVHEGLATPDITQKDE